MPWPNYTIEEREAMRSSKAPALPSIGEKPPQLGLFDFESVKIVEAPKPTENSPPAPPAPTQSIQSPPSIVDSKISNSRPVVSAPEPFTSRTSEAKPTTAGRFFSFVSEVFRRGRILIPVALIVSICSMSLSGYYGYQWFSTVAPAALAPIFAFVITTCSTLLPEFVIMLIKKGRKYIPIACAVGLVAAISTTLSISGTLMGMYEHKTKAERAATNQDASKAAQEYAILAESGARLSSDFARKASEIEALNTRIAAAPNGSKEYYNVTWLKTVAEKNLSEIQDKIDKNEEKKLAAVARQDYTIKRADVFTFLGGKLNQPAGNVEFGVYAAPAVFFDIVSPVMLAMALFL